MKLDKIEKMCKLFEYLNLGNSAEIGGRTYVLSSDKRLAIPTYNDDGSKTGDCLPVQFTTDEFANICDTLDDDQMWFVCSQIALDKNR